MLHLIYRQGNRGLEMGTELSEVHTTTRLGAETRTQAAGPRNSYSNHHITQPKGTGQLLNKDLLKEGMSEALLTDLSVRGPLL